MRFRKEFFGLPLLLTTLTLAPSALAFPGFMAGKTKAPVVHQTQIVMMKKGPTSVVTVMPDYQGPLEPSIDLRGFTVRLPPCWVASRGHLSSVSWTPPRAPCRRGPLRRRRLCSLES